MAELILIPEEPKENKNKVIKEKKYKYSEREQIRFLKGFQNKREVLQLELNFSNNSDKSNSYSLRSLEEAYADKTPVDLTPEQYKRLNKIINGIAIKRYGWLQIPKEEVVSELWVKAFEVIKRCQDFIPSIIARALWNRLNDICRAVKKRKEKVILSSEWLEKIETEDEKDGQTLSVEDDNTSKIYIQEMLKLFPEGSIEKLYFKALIFQLGLDEFLDKNEAESFKNQEDELVVNNERLKHRKESKIAKLLGFNAESSPDYKLVKESVRRILIGNGYQIPH